MSSTSNVATNALQATLVGRLDEFVQSLGEDTEVVEALLCRDFKKDATSDNLLFWGSYKGHSSVMDLYQQRFPGVFAKVLLPVVSHLFSLQKDIPAVSLLVRNGTPSLVVSNSSGQNALHVLCSRRTPNAQLIAELLQHYTADDDINLADIHGLTALHLVAKHSTGSSGKTVAVMLMKMGADTELQCEDGKTVRMVATNPFVREVVGFGALKYRDVPQLDSESRAQLDRTAVDQFPPILPIDTEPPRLDRSETVGSQASISSPQRGDRKVLQSEDVDALVARLYTQSVRQKEASMAQMLQALEPVENRRLTQEEQDAVGERLWRAEMEQRADKKAQLMDKYSPERERQPLDFETQAESANRLCNAALDHKKQSHEVLESKYWAVDPKLTKKLTKGQQQACATRLHDQCQEKTRETFTSIASKYLDKEKTRFAGGVTITPEKIKEMANRLSTRK